MKIAVSISPRANGMWRWSLKRGGIEGSYGETDSLPLAEKEAEKAARRYARALRQTKSYLFDTDTGERTGIEIEEG